MLIRIAKSLEEHFYVDNYDDIIDFDSQYINISDISNSVGTLVVTDFSKAFDCVDHTLAIQELCTLGVRSEIIPWIADFWHLDVSGSNFVLPCLVGNFSHVVSAKAPSLVQSSLFPSLTMLPKSQSLSLAEVRQAHRPSQIDLDVRDLDAWANCNHLKLNPSKCKVIQICFKREPPPGGGT